MLCSINCSVTGKARGQQLLIMFEHSIHLMRPALLLVLPVLILGCCGKKPQASTPPPEVQVTEVKPEDVAIYDDFVGTLEPSVNASIQARVPGYLASQDYREGTLVKAGDVLFKIDPRPFEAGLAEARAALAQAEANLVETQSVAERTARLAAQQAVSTQETENARQQAFAAKAMVEARKAAVARSELDVEFTTIRSPVDGIAGFARAQVGDLVGPATGVLTTVSTVDPIKAYFTVSDQRYVAYTQRWAGNPEGRAEHERNLEFELILANGSVYPHKGRLFAVANDVDVRTGAQRIATVFPNPDNSLRGGQFARVRMRAEIRRDALLVPQRAVTDLQGIFQVVVIGADNKAEIRPVKVGRRLGPRWLVEEGLQPGERVVVEGLQKAQQGVVVNPQPWTPPQP